MILDGAFSTELERKGCDLNDPLWSAKIQVAAVGINCTAPEYVSSLIDEIRKGTDKPIIIYPNSGESYDAENKTWHGSSADQSYGKNARLWYEKGAKIIGGCCRTRPEDIKEINSWGRNLL